MFTSKHKRKGDKKQLFKAFVLSVIPTQEKHTSYTRIAVTQSCHLSYQHKIPPFLTREVQDKSTYELINLSTYQLINLSTYQLKNTSTYQLKNSSTQNISNSPTHQLTNSPTHQLENLNYFLLFYNIAPIFAPF